MIKNKKGAMAISQILILIIGIVAVSFMIGGSIEVVSAGGGSEEEEKECKEGESECKLGLKYECVEGEMRVNIFDDESCRTKKNIAPVYQPPSTPDPADKRESDKDKKTKMTWRDYLALKEFLPDSITDKIDSGVDAGKDFFLEDVLGLDEISKLRKVQKEAANLAELGKERLKWFELSRTIFGQIFLNTVTAIGIGYSVREFAMNHGQSISQGNSLGLTASSFYYTTKTVNYFIKRAIVKKALEDAGVDLTTRAGKRAIARGLKQGLHKGSEAATTEVLKNILGAVGIEKVPTWLTPGLLSFGAGLAISGIIFLLTYRKRAFEVVSFQCNVWDSEKGGSYCEECNKGNLPCTEYQCRSLGRSCQLINVGTEKELCAFVGRNDTKYPIINPWEDVLLEDYTYSPLETISPQDRGVFVNYENSADGCIPAFTDIAFGLTLNEPAKCKMSFTRASSFEEMGNNWFSNGADDYNHSYFGSSSSAEVIEVESLVFGNDGYYEAYVRCEDRAGNSNPANFVFKFCTDPSPDLTPPKIVTADPLNEAPILHDLQSTPVNIYVNKPSDCKWSRTNQDYVAMENSMTCAQDETGMNAQRLFKCSTTVDGLKNEIENKFYFRCKSYPTKEESERVAMAQSYEYSLFGTRPLVINSVSPNETTIKDYTSSVKVTLEVETSAGYEDGRAMCSYSEDGENYIIFLGDETFENYEHSQDLYLAEGEYDYYIKCVDLGGNTDTAAITFEVATDTSAPIIVRVYREDEYLKLVTDEEAECVYDNIDCSYDFDDGLPMVRLDDFEHYIDWNSNINFYIKCKDNYGQYPPQDQCSMIVRPFDLE